MARAGAKWNLRLNVFFSSFVLCPSASLECSIPKPTTIPHPLSASVVHFIDKTYTSNSSIASGPKNLFFLTCIALTRSMPCYNATSSNASLQNNIGALLLYESSKSTQGSTGMDNIQLAKERFYASIVSGNQLPPSSTTTQKRTNKTSMTTTATMDMDGLTWFHNKLLREKREHNPLPNVLKIEMTHGIPLGLEYIHFPMIVATGCEVGSTLASVLNLACLMWAQDKSWKNVAQILSWCFQLKVPNTKNGKDNRGARSSRCSCSCSWCTWRKDHEPYVNVVSSSERTEHDYQWSSYANAYLMAIAHNNMGIVHFCQNRAKQALNEFDEARRLVEELYNSSYYSPSRIKCSARPTRLSSLSEFHMEYLNLATLLNQTRTCIRLNDMARSSALIPKLAALNFPSRAATATVTQSSTPLCPQLQQGFKFLLVYSPYFSVFFRTLFYQSSFYTSYKRLFRHFCLISVDDSIMPITPIKWFHGD